MTETPYTLREMTFDSSKFLSLFIWLGFLPFVVGTIAALLVLIAALSHMNTSLFGALTLVAAVFVACGIAALLNTFIVMHLVRTKRMFGGARLVFARDSLLQKGLSAKGAL